MKDFMNWAYLVGFTAVKLITLKKEYGVIFSSDTDANFPD